jgi:uncharacterized membrane protein
MLARVASPGKRISRNAAIGLPTMPPDAKSAIAARVALASLIALAMLALAWETVLAPVKPGGSWLALKALPLVVLLPGALRGRVRSLQWLSLLLPFYVAEGIVRGFSERGRHAVVAWAAAFVATVAFVALLAWLRGMRR